ncbi:BamA/OMP85 family outer membrane protein [Fodinibius sp. Rm-B-1B1-1]|uniref:BamA/OMP85 family outer membrane protein n=1 Tax=Fodinibius alkaliphilus TaxID=3140241 RepID=UPI00315AA55A
MRLLGLEKYVLLFTICMVAGVTTTTAQRANNGSEVHPQVWEVTFEGNKTYSNMVLKNQVATEAPGFGEKLKFWDKTGFELDEQEIKRDVIRIRNYYQRRGFINVKVNYSIQTKNKEWKKEVTFRVKEQLPIRIADLVYEVEGATQHVKDVRASSAYQRTQRDHPYQKNNRYEMIKEPEVVGRFTDVLKNMGYAYAEVNIKADIDSTALTANVTIQSDLGPRTYIDSVEVEGIESIDKDYVMLEADLKRGERYSMDKLQEAQQQIFDHHLFRFATISIPDQPKDSTLNLIMRVRENEKRSVELLAGFGTEDKLRGQVSWTHRNVGHRAHRFNATARASFIEQFATINYLFPYVYNTKSSVVISPFGQHMLESNYELFRAGVTNSFIYRYSQNLTASASHEFTKNQELSRSFDTTLPDSTLEYDLSSLQLSGYYSQGYGRQQEGWVIQPYFELSGFFGFASYSFQKLSADIRRFTRLGNSTMLATRLKGGAIFSAKSDSLPSNIRYYLGGTNSVRGWYRNQLGPKNAQTDSTGFEQYVPRGGSAMFGFNIELRQELNFLIDGLGMAAFFDGGQLWETFARIRRRPVQFGVGGGFRYQSPIGPVRIDVGYKLNPTERDLNIYQGTDYGGKWERIGIHFSIGQAF